MQRYDFLLKVRAIGDYFLLKVRAISGLVFAKSQGNRRSFLLKSRVRVHENLSQSHFFIEIATVFMLESCRNLVFFVTLRQVLLKRDRYEGEYCRQRGRDREA